MSQVSVKSMFTQTTESGDQYEPVGRLAGFGSLIGLAAAAFGLVFGAGNPLIPVPSMLAPLLKDSVHYTNSAIFIGLLSLGLLIQMRGSSELKRRLGTSFPSVGYLTALVGFLLAGITMYGGLYWNNSAEVASYVQNLAIVTAIFLILWQFFSSVYVDASESWIGFFAGIFNGMALLFLGIGQALGSLFVFIAYILLAVGQLSAMFFWWSPLSSIRIFARSPEKAKFAFGVTGFLTFLIGALAIFNGALGEQEGVSLWYPWTTHAENYEYLTNPALIWAFCGALLFWILLGPRLGKKELKVAHVSDDIIKGGSKFFMIFLASLGIFTAAMVGTNFGLSVAGWALFLTWCPAGVMFIAGGIYAGRTDIVTGLPLVIASIFILVHPYSLSQFVIIPYILVIVSQFFLMLETKIRGFTYFQQGTLSVIVTLAFSALFVWIMLGGLGSGPSALWPTNRWFNIDLFSDFSRVIQAPTIMVLPIMVLLVRNVALVGYAYGRGITGKDILAGISMLFALLIPIIASAFKGVTHQALTAASIMLALYAMSFVLVLSLNLNLAEKVEDTGNPIEGMLIRMTAITAIVLGAIVAVYTLTVFSGFPSALQVSGAITLLVILVTGLEILTFIGWLSAGIRLGMLSSGFSFKRASDEVVEVPEEVVAPIHQ